MSVVNERDGDGDGDRSKGGGMLRFSGGLDATLDNVDGGFDGENELVRSLEFRTEEKRLSDQLLRSLSLS